MGFGRRSALSVLAFSVSACYSPNLPSGMLKCGPSASCPDGYRCLDADQTCWKNGESPTNDAGGGSDAGIFTPGPEAFVGHWIYQAGSTENVTCTDGSDKTNDLATDYVDVALNGTTLTATYFCAWNVTLDSKMTSTVLAPGQSCARDMTDATTGLTHFMWHGTTFTMTMTSATMATLKATIGENVVDDPTKTGCGPTTTPCAGTCTIKIDGTLLISP
jgi:hypothetical protein